MARTYPSSIPSYEAPQYAYALAIFCGGIIFLTPQLGSPVAPWVFYALLAMLFGALWPNRAWQWGAWLCLPMILLLCLDLALTWNIISTLSNNGLPFVKSLAAACLGAHLGSKLSVRKSAHHRAVLRASGRRLHSDGSGVQAGGFLNELAPVIASDKNGLAARRSDGYQQATGPVMQQPEFKGAEVGAALAGELVGVGRLFAYDAEAGKRGLDDWPPLLIATRDAEVEKMDTACDAGQVAVGDEGWTALMIATIKGQREVVRELLRDGSAVNATNDKGWTALRFAVSMNEAEIACLLLDAGADVNTTDNLGRTPLMQAASENSEESLKALLEAGADTHIKDRAGKTALMLAKQHGYAEIVKLLKEAEAKSANRMRSAIDVLADDNLKAADKTHRVIKVCRDQFYGLLDRYEAIPKEASLPRGCEETGLEGNEEECWNHAWKNNIGGPAELGWWLHFER